MSLSQDQIEQAVSELEFNWKQSGSSLSLELKTKNFSEAIWVIDEIAKVAEELNHHPDLSLSGYNNLVITLQSHDASEITQKDLELAEKIDAIISRIDGK